MGISLYTSRIILQKLGVEDFGIYNLVGGVVVLFSFLNNSMASATQRFINIALSKKDRLNSQKIFCTSMNLHIMLSIVVILLAETIGLWFLNNKLNVPENRLYAANFVYQMSVITTVFNIVRIPYNATILANEKMSFYAYFSVFEGVMKLLVVLSLFFNTSKDDLILYSVLLCVVSALANLTIKIYTHKYFKIETKYKWFYDKALSKEMFQFSSWNILGQIANVSANQGVSMILNIFIGVTVNAAMGIANQVNTAVFSFISNFQLAFNPQITQSYAKNEIENHKKLVFNSSKYSFFLMSLLAAPLILNTQFILNVWLGPSLPNYVVPFTQIVILISLIDSLSGPFWMSAHAIGNIKNYQILLSIIVMLNVPIAYLLLMKGFSPTVVLGSKFFLAMFAWLYRVFYVKESMKIQIKTIMNYFKKIIPISLLFIGIFVISRLQVINANNWGEFLVTTLTIELMVVVLIASLGINKIEKNLIQTFILTKLKRNA